jgi:hypothetical protein
MRRRIEGELHWKLFLHDPVTTDTTVTKCLWTDCNNLGIQIKKKYETEHTHTHTHPLTCL